MNASTIASLKTGETRAVEAAFQPHFEHVDCYRHSPYILRLCVIDEQLRPLSQVQRHELVEPLLQSLPQNVQDDLLFVLLLAPGEANEIRYAQRYLEFVDPTPPLLESPT
jgi:hypothetical protein